MATNEIYPFGSGGTVEDGDVMLLADYLVEPQRLGGHQLGIARRELMNMVLRQTSHMAAGLAEFIAGRYMPGVVDDGDLQKIVSGLTAAIVDIIENTPHDHLMEEVTGLVGALEGKADVDHVHPESVWSESLTGNGYTVQPNGLILQWGKSGPISENTGAISITLPISFPTQGLMGLAGPDRSLSVNGVASAYVSFASTSQITLVYDSTATIPTDEVFWFVLGH
ncbi:MAG: hypothetical protein CL942_08490 [Desulfovibrio sp.]|nr:hypothetical protein [Desulfovibrio sp.]|tara:strand:+ start:28932 stop:29603 length:672 start_codon:yes stop_codon:yes gene_type:complete